MELKRVTLREFLQRSNSASLPSLPLVHTTQAVRLLDILNTKSLAATPCNVFAGEKLCYMFVGRPAYKVRPSEDPQYWELPVAFIMSFRDSPKAKRIFPFDSGAFRSGMLPNSITLFPLESFDISGDSSLINRFIAAFYGTNEAFYKGRSRSIGQMKDEHIIGIREMAVEATVALHQERLQSTMDDRARSIEVQFDEDIALREGSLIAVILPEQFKSDPEYDRTIRSLCPEVRYYETYPLQTASYYSQIYNITKKIIGKYADD